MNNASFRVRGLMIGAFLCVSLCVSFATLVFGGQSTATGDAAEVLALEQKIGGGFVLMPPLGFDRAHDNAPISARGV